MTKNKITSDEYRQMFKNGELSVDKDGRIIRNKLSPEYKRILEKAREIKKKTLAKISIKNQALLKEFENYLTKKYSDSGWTKEVVFSSIMDTKRKFRADYFLTNEKTIIEINGGQFITGGGRHNRGGEGYENDLMKSNIAQKFGFKYFQFTYQQLGRQEYQIFI